MGTAASGASGSPCGRMTLAADASATSACRAVTSNASTLSLRCLGLPVSGEGASLNDEVVTGRDAAMCSASRIRATSSSFLPEVGRPCERSSDLSSVTVRAS